MGRAGRGAARGKGGALKRGRRERGGGAEEGEGGAAEERLARAGGEPQRRQGRLLPRIKRVEHIRADPQQLATGVFAWSPSVFSFVCKHNDRGLRASSAKAQQ